MARIDDVARVAMGLPEVTEGRRYGHRTWFVSGRAFVWHRPFSKADIRRFGPQSPPDGPIVAVLVLDLDDKRAALAAHPGVVFTIPHFDGYPAVLVDLDRARLPVLRPLLTDGWLAAAAPPLVEAFVGRGRRRPPQR